MKSGPLLAPPVSYPVAHIRLVTVTEDSGEETKWCLMGKQDAQDTDGRWYTRLFLQNGQVQRTDITMDVLEFNRCLHDFEWWPICELVISQVGVSPYPGVASMAYPVVWGT